MQLGISSLNIHYKHLPQLQVLKICHDFIYTNLVAEMKFKNVLYSF